MDNRATKIFFCQECGHRDTEGAFGEACRCPHCRSLDVIDYGLWKRHSTETPPPRRIAPGHDESESFE